MSALAVVSEKDDTEAPGVPFVTRLNGAAWSAPPKTDILIKDGEQDRQVDEVLSVVRARRQLYERGGEIVMPTVNGIHILSEPWLREWTARNCLFYKTGIKKLENGKTQRFRLHKDVPKVITAMIMGKKAERGLPILRAVATAPTMRPDGSILSSPDTTKRRSSISLSKNHSFQSSRSLKILLAPIGRPSRRSGTRLRSSLLSRLAIVAWPKIQCSLALEPMDRGKPVAAILTAAIRRSLPTAPGFVLEAPAAGTGKTLLAECLCILMGSEPDLMSGLDRDEAEMRKRLLAHIRGGKPILAVDNITGVLSSSTLAGFLTAEFFGDRLLGVSETVTYRTDTLFVMTANNLALGGDLWRRFLFCRIDAACNHPDQRVFDLEPKSYCRKHRQEIISSALTLLAGFVAAGSPKIAKTGFASYEAWGRLVRNTVLWMQAEGITEGIAELGDPCHGIQDAKEQCDDQSRLATVLECVSVLYGDMAFTCGDLIRKVSAQIDISEPGADPDDGPLARLVEAIGEIVAAKTTRELRDAAAVLALGNWIEKYREVWIDGLCFKPLQRSEKSKKSRKYRVIRTGAGADEGVVSVVRAAVDDCPF